MDLLAAFGLPVLVGILIGILSGLLGIGGGTIMVPVFRLAFGLSPLMSTATSLFTIIPTSISGAVSHIKGKTCVPALGLTMGVGGALTSPVGVWLASLSPAWLVMLAAALIIGYSAVNMLRKAVKAPSKRKSAGLKCESSGPSAAAPGDSGARRSAAQDPSDPSCAPLLQSDDAIDGVQTVAPSSPADADARVRYRIEIVKNTATPESTAQDTSVLLLDAAPVFKALLDDRAAGVPVGVIARRFHDAFVQAIADVAELCRALYGIGTVALSGGVFMNRHLIEHALEALERAGFTVAVNRELPPNDGCVSYGQAVVAWAANDEKA